MAENIREEIIIMERLFVFGFSDSGSLILEGGYARYYYRRH